MTPNALLPHLKEFCHITDACYALGWNERNGGNLSVCLDDPALANLPKLREITMDFCAPELAGQVYLVTGTGRYFRNVSRSPEQNAGLVRIASDGTTLEVLWGFAEGGRPTSELPTHLMSHRARRAVDSDSRVVLHAHPGYLLCMTRTHDLDERAFTRALWRTITECMVVFPDGVAVLPWMLCGTPEIGEETAKKMEKFRLVVWAQHGIFAAGRDLDEVFGLLETVEKSAEIVVKTMHLPKVQAITDAELRIIADAFGVTPQEGFLVPAE